MAHRLPDETLKEILTPALTISEDEFSFADAENNPFGKKYKSSGVVLLVCKRWMRVATPLLYETVIIRSKAQAQAIVDALTANPHFGAYVRKLRIEGGYGMSPFTVISKSPNITNLFITLDVYSTDNATGICKALPLVNPRRFIFTKHTRANNPKSQKLLDEITRCIKYRWLSLETLEFHSDRMFSVEEHLEDALRASSSVRHLVFTHCSEEFLEKLAAFSNLQSIRITFSLDALFMRDVVDSSPALTRLVKFEEIVECHGRMMPRSFALPLVSTASRPPLIAEPTPGFTPLINVLGSVADSIWSLIFSFATYPRHPSTQLLSQSDAPGIHNNIDGRGFSYSKSRNSASDLSLVSKYFHTLVEPHLFRVVGITCEGSLSAFCDLMSVKPGRGALVRILYFPLVWNDFEVHSSQVTSSSAISLGWCNSWVDQVST
ncbi:hypothetical protein BD410DRAFT_47053 [Rickenella mellea]|uniref:Uncharacterized protein n=1 Tax=Rickenella mellea TaxID=50990 RepID=A0A4V3AZP6_9AGAM|nr:hypothetical protein BD410DRAFT_47053 [Rickenella mellea]